MYDKDLEPRQCPIFRTSALKRKLSNVALPELLRLSSFGAIFLGIPVRYYVCTLAVVPN